MRLAVVVIRVLAEDDDAHGLEWRQIERSENVLFGWKDLMRRALSSQELPQIAKVAFFEFRADDRDPRFWQDHGASQPPISARVVESNG
jgi:hypothetical protein